MNNEPGVVSATIELDLLPPGSPGGLLSLASSFDRVGYTKLARYLRSCADAMRAMPVEPARGGDGADTDWLCSALGNFVAGDTLTGADERVIDQARLLIRSLGHAVPSSAPSAPPATDAPEPCEADELLREIGLDPERFRSEGGWLNAGKVLAAIRNPVDYAGLYLTLGHAWAHIPKLGGDICASCGAMKGTTRANEPCATPPAGGGASAGAPLVLLPVLAEIERATRKFPTWPTDPLHALGVVGEEFGELGKAVLQAVYEPHKSGRDQVRDEAIQTAAMAIRFIASLDAYDYSGSAQHQQSDIANERLAVESVAGTAGC